MCPLSEELVAYCFVKVHLTHSLWKKMKYLEPWEFSESMQCFLFHQLFCCQTLLNPCTYSLFPCHTIKNRSGVGSFWCFVSFIFINWEKLECQSLVEQTNLCHEESGIKEFKSNYILERRRLCMSYASLILILYNLNY